MATSSQAATSDPASGASSRAASGPPPATTAASSSTAGASVGGPSSTKDQTSSSPKSSPPAAATTTLPVRDKDSLNKVLIDRFVTRDWIHTIALRDSQEHTKKSYSAQLEKRKEYRAVRNEFRQWFPPSRLYGEGYNGFGNGHTEARAPAQIIYPVNKPRPGKRNTAPLRASRKDTAQQADQHEELVPVRLDVDWDKVKLRDTFTWNLHDRVTPIDIFAAQLTEDMGLKAPLQHPVYDQIMLQIHEQLTDFYPIVFSEEDALDPELPYSAYKNDEMRILIKLNITIGQHTLVDQFEWEMNNPLNSPEEFAASMSRDLSLSGEFTTAIAHCIREQTQLFTKSLYSIGHPFDGRPVEDPDLVTSFLPSPLPAVFRPQQQAKEYAPYLYELNEADLERNEVIFSREQRRQKRSVNRRGGPQLPDLKDRQRTIRTLIVSSVLPGAALEVEDSRLYKRAAGAGIAGRKRGAGARDGDLSDSDSSDDSSPDSPGTSQLQGTARTRNMRGAATAAQLRMANLGRSETPEAATIHHHETRTSRRFNPNAREARDSTEEPGTFIITVKVPRERLRKLLRDMKAARAAAAAAAPKSGSHTPSAQPQRLPSAGASAMGPPPTTPSAASQSLPAKPAATPATTLPPAQLGWVPAKPPPPPGQPGPPPPPPPEWLTDCFTTLRKQYPNDMYEGLMRFCAMDAHTDELVQPAPPPGEPIPDNIKFMYVPRIRCLDCPGKLYTPGPDMTVTNFEVHLRNRQHREKVDRRIGKAGPAAAAAARAAAAPAPSAGGPASAAAAAAVPPPGAPVPES